MRTPAIGIAATALLTCSSEELVITELNQIGARFGGFAQELARPAVAPVAIR